LRVHPSPWLLPVACLKQSSTSLHQTVSINHILRLQGFYSSPRATLQLFGGVSEVAEPASSIRLTTTGGSFFFSSSWSLTKPHPLHASERAELSLGVAAPVTVLTDFSASDSITANVPQLQRSPLMGPRMSDSTDDAPPDLERGVHAPKGAPRDVVDAPEQPTLHLPSVPITLKVEYNLRISEIWLMVPEHGKVG
jgi:hypothetical protein